MLLWFALVGLSCFQSCGLLCPTPICFHTRQALRSLKAKQRTEKRIEALHAKLDTVQGILDRIYASQTDQMVATPFRALWSQSPTLHLPPLWPAISRGSGFFQGVAGFPFLLESLTSVGVR